MSAGGGRVRVLVAEDHPLFRRAVVRAVKARPELELVAETTDGREALEEIADSPPTWPSWTCECQNWTVSRS